jgi:hypothetical protein
MFTREIPYLPDNIGTTAPCNTPIINLTGILCGSKLESKVRLPRDQAFFS